MIWYLPQDSKPSNEILPKLQISFTGILVTQYLQKVTSRLSIGAELVCQYGPQVPGGEFTALSVASKLTGK